jgi:hypothetical protein
MRHRLLVSAVFGLSLLSLSFSQSPAQAPASAQGLTCNGTRLLDPFPGPLARPLDHLPPISDKDKSEVLRSGLPCQENVTAATTTTVPPSPDGKEAEGLESLQRGFDYYSWRTFIALNSPADSSIPIEQAQADTPTLWEDMNSFKQLLDVMLPANLQPPKWPVDGPGMEAERERLVPPECRDLHQKMPTRMIVKMIEESFNEPFKTGALIDQNGNYAIFDILMNRQMFQYIMDHQLNTKAGQAANTDLSVDFPAGQNTDKSFGAFMLKVSWKILSDAEIQAKNFHMREALVLMPPPADPKSTEARPCLAKTLGLIGFHAVHKTASRPQWIWTSFEHAQNVPDRNEVNAKKFNGPYNFFSTSCGSNCPAENATPPRPWDPDPAFALKYTNKDPDKAQFRSQIIRETPLTDAAKNMNKIFHSLLPNSVWQNYMLLSTQWPSAFGCTQLRAKDPNAPVPKTDFFKQPDMTCAPVPTFFANSTLETYSQGNVPLASSSCIACHGNAVGFQRGASNRQQGKPNLNQSDFTFMLEKAQ